MVLFKSLVLSSLALLAMANESHVLDLIPKNFDDVVLKSGKPTLVEFFAPWCGHCKKLAPIYEDLGTIFAPFKDKVQIARVDADAEKELGTRFGVQGFPTLKWFDGKTDKPEEYGGGRELDDLAAFITEKTGARPKQKQVPPTKVTMLNDESFAKEAFGDKHLLVAFTTPWCGHCKELAPTWENLATDYERDSQVLIAKINAEAADSKKTASQEGVTGYPTIKFYKAGGKFPEVYQGGRSEWEIVEWLNDRVGAYRMAGGELNVTAGCVEALDKIVAGKLDSGKADIAKMTAEVNKAIKSLTGAPDKKFAPYYQKVLEKLAKDQKYAKREMERLWGIISKTGLTGKKRDELTLKVNVLRVFCEKHQPVHVKDEL